MSVVHTQVAYILHKRDYRETSSIIELLTRDFGRVSLIARGSRGSKSRIAASLMPFRPLLVSWQGRRDLPYLKSVERAELSPPSLQGKALYSAMYVNELLVYLLQRHDVHEGLFETYHECLYNLAEPDRLELGLRRFEIMLLEQLGFALNLESEAGTDEAIRADADYRYIPEHGLIRQLAAAGADHARSGGVVISGRCIVALAEGGVEAIADRPQLLLELKRLMRFILEHHLGGRRLRSRELFNTVAAGDQRPARARF